MSSRKMSLITTFVGLFLILAVCFVSVYAATSHTLGVNTTISFTATGVNGSISGTLTGLESDKTFAEWQFAPEDSINEEVSKPWTINSGDKFKILSAVPQNLVFTFTIKNLSGGNNMKATLSNIVLPSNLELVPTTGVKEINQAGVTSNLTVSNNSYTTKTNITPHATKTAKFIVTIKVVDPSVDITAKAVKFDLKMTKA